MAKLLHIHTATTTACFFLLLLVRLAAAGGGEEEESDEGEPLRCITSWDCTSVQACKQECSRYSRSYGSCVTSEPPHKVCLCTYDCPCPPPSP
ncbi:hypothetical protein Pyn_17527 [Prunus yedoensis var. nudiflora]|uniref:Defensin-like protein n=1 Tax=Prunus yedoensis var. nudiflora TaxID=2094558 RepID=A0A314UPM3_PRUYE|nr:hypothetical protein Pyn_17527 [Prunus yedoensis var. nudiflora]